METLTSPLVERVQAFVQASDAPVEWGSPLLSTAPAAPLAVKLLAAQLAGAEKALRESALEVERMALEVQELEAQVAAATAEDLDEELDDELRAMFGEAIARKFEAAATVASDAARPV